MIHSTQHQHWKRSLTNHFKYEIDIRVVLWHGEIVGVNVVQHAFNDILASVDWQGELDHGYGWHRFLLSTCVTT